MSVTLGLPSKFQRPGALRNKQLLIIIGAGEAVQVISIMMIQVLLKMYSSTYPNICMTMMLET